MIFGWEQKEENNNITINSSRLDILTLLTLLSADAKSAVLCVLLRVPSLTKVEVCDFPLLNFPGWPCLIYGQLGMSLRRVKRTVIFKCHVSAYSIFDNGQFYLKYYFLRHWNPPLKEIQLRVNCYVSILIFHSPKY